MSEYSVRGSKPNKKPIYKTHRQKDKEHIEHENQLEDEVEELKKQLQEHTAGWQRAQADYKNLQRETEQRLSEMAKYGTERFILELLPMVDHFNYALAGIPAADRGNAWVTGIEYIRDNFIKVLQAHGVEVMEDLVGKHFDPATMEAVEELDIPGESGVVEEVIASGFWLNGKLIQPAKVKTIK